MPEISLRRTHSLFDPFIERAKKIGRLHAAVTYPIHAKIIQAVHEAHAAGLIDPIFNWPKDRILLAASDAGIDISDYKIINVDNSHSAISKAITLAREGEVGLLIRGAAIREDLIHAIQRAEKGLIGDRHISYALVLDVPTDRKPLILTDTFN